jgi:hypothetical protein
MRSSHIKSAYQRQTPPMPHVSEGAALKGREYRIWSDSLTKSPGYLWNRNEAVSDTERH